LISFTKPLIAMKKHHLFHAAKLLLWFFLPSSLPAQGVEIRGVYGNPEAFWAKGLKLNELGVNAVFVHGYAVNEALIARARTEGLKVFAEFPTLNGKGYVEEHPEAWPINEKGEQAEAADWFMGVCPTEPGFRHYRMKQLRELLQRLDVDGVWMDYVHWHAQFETPEPILPETCFCEHCLTRFQAASGIAVPDGKTAEKAAWILTQAEPEWRDWRAEVIASWARDMKAIIRQVKPKTLLGLYHCPWQDEEYQGARRRILGLDYSLLRPHIDVFSPMVYHAHMHRPPEWIRENIEWFCAELDIPTSGYPKVWPILQAYNQPRVISAEEFAAVLRYGLSAQVSGLKMFTTYAVAEDEQKTAVMKEFYITLGIAELRD
jgi:hypothetical protein